MIMLKDVVLVSEKVNHYSGMCALYHIPLLLPPLFSPLLPSLLPKNPKPWFIIENGMH
jgi:hypothetical protein